MPEVSNQGLEEILENVLTTGNSYVSQEQEFQLPRLNGVETLYVNYIYEPMKDMAGNIEDIMVVAIEVTQQVLARNKIEEVVTERTKELAATNLQLQQSNTELQQFAYIASHDLQEPVRKIGTFTGLLARSLGDIDERSKTYLEKIFASSQRMLNLISDILSFSQLSRKSEPIDKVDLKEILNNVLIDLELVIEQKNAIITCKQLPVIEAIPLQINQLFYNILSNSLKFSRIDVIPEIQITAKTLSPAQVGKHPLLLPGITYHCIKFIDNGIGFNQKYAEQIFNIFQRLHGQSEFVGTGIGLAMCKKIVLNHHGEIFAFSAPNEGSTFEIILPETHHQ